MCASERTVEEDMQACKTEDAAVVGSRWNVGAARAAGKLSVGE